MLTSKRFLVIEDETLLRKSLVAYLESAGADATGAASLQAARSLCASETYDGVLLDVNLPDGNGIQFLREVGFPQTTTVVIMTAEGGVRTAVEAMRNGAADYLAKPFEPEALPMVFSRAFRQRSQQRIIQFSDERDAGPALFRGRRLSAIEQQLTKIIAADARLGSRLPPVLIEGETGTGKSSIARWLHAAGPRSSTPLVEVNASTLPEALAESELFGHERGAFTDARKERIGLFEAADGGSLFIDEISSLSPAVQAKILTAIEDQQIRRLGGNRNLPVDVRLIAASLHPLQQLVKEGSFREDLFHRLHLLTLQIPPLRDFPDDIPPLAEHILEGLRTRYRAPDATISSEGIEQLQRHPWPGNIRELIHELERAMVFHDGSPFSFPHLASGSSTQDSNSDLLNPRWQLPASGFAFEAALKQLTVDVIRRAMDAEDGNISAAARRLGVPRDFIRYRIGQ